MGFLTELFSRPRPQELARYRAARALHHTVMSSERAGIDVKPADFPRIARQPTLR